MLQIQEYLRSLSSCKGGVPCASRGEVVLFGTFGWHPEIRITFMSYPLKLSLKSEIVPIILVLASWLFAIYFYIHFPAQVVTHWGFEGRPNGYMGKIGGAFLLPAIITGLYLFFLALPWADPRRERYAE